MNILSRLFEKRGIKDESELSSEERVQFDQWKAILSKEDFTVDNMIEYCDSMVVAIEVQFKDLNTSKEKLAGLVLQHSIYKSLRQVIKSPQAERAALERYLTDQIK